MAKRIGNDIILPKRKAHLIESLQHRAAAQSVSTTSESPKRKPLKLGWLIWAILIVALAGSGIYATSLFSYASIKVVPHRELLSLDDTFTLGQDAHSGSLLMKTMKLSAEATLDVAATAKKQLSEKATGEVVLYNNFDTKPQQLIARTRLMSPTGKIYRLVTDVTIPGATVVLGKRIPGSTTTTIVASVPGADYNAPLQDFTIPAFLTTPRATTVYGRSKSPLSGGKIGEVLVPTDTAMQKAQEQLEKQLAETLTARAIAQTPAEYILIRDGLFFTFTDSTSETTSTTNVRIKKSATLEGILMKKADFITAIAKKKIPSYKDQPVVAPDLSSLRFSLPDKASINIDTMTTSPLRVQGKLALTYAFDREGFRQALAGLPKKEYIQVLTNYPAIDTAEISFNPRWVTSFPTHPERIEVIVAGQ